MATAKTQFVCRECGNTTAKWLGQCPACQAWNTLEEFRLPKKDAGGRRPAAGMLAETSSIALLSEVPVDTVPRLPTGLAEFDRVLGGGMVPGSVVLIGGDPGIGKSTLLLQALALMSQSQRVLYVSGEESLAQVALRGARLGIDGSTLPMLAEVSLAHITQAIEQVKPAVVVIDSIQTMMSDDLQSAPGSVSQVRDCAAQLTRLAKQQGVAVVMIGHVTKEGALAGPRILEHMVDTVLYFEGDSHSTYRLIRAIKNRFGAVNELGVFGMTDRGLKAVTNPSALFLSQHVDPVSGSCVLITQEARGRCWWRSRRWWTSPPAAHRADCAWAWIRCGCRCCWPCSTAMPASSTTIRTCSCTRWAACASPSRRLTWLSCWPCCRR